MPLTKSEFDRWKAQRDEACDKIADNPYVDRLCKIDGGGYLRFTANADGFGPESTRALYEMLRAWYGDDAPSPAMSANEREVIDAATSWRCGCSELQRIRRAVDAYVAEQAEKEKTQ